MENRIHCSNLRFIGLLERAEGKDPAEYLENLLITAYGREAFSVIFAVGRVHRIYQQSPHLQEHPPRTFIAKFLNFRDWDKIVRLTREKGNIQVGNDHVAVFPDFSKEVQQKRSQFQDVKRRLRVLHLKYAMIFPARLRVEEDDRVQFFETPATAEAWLDRRGRPA